MKKKYTFSYASRSECEMLPEQLPLINQYSALHSNTHSSTYSRNITIYYFLWKYIFNKFAVCSYLTCIFSCLGKIYSVRIHFLRQRQFIIYAMQTGMNKKGICNIRITQCIRRTKFCPLNTHNLREIYKSRFSLA